MGPEPDGSTLWRVDRESLLTDLAALIERDPCNISLRFHYANVLAELGRTDEAIAAYWDLLTRDPSHRGSLNNLGVLLYSANRWQAARTCFAEAVSIYPEDPVGHLNLGNVLRESGDLHAALEQYVKCLALDADNRQAHRGLAMVFDELGDETKAWFHRDAGFKGAAIQFLPYYGRGPGVPLLVLSTAGRGNTPLGPLLNTQIFRTSVAVVEYVEQAHSLSPYQLIVNGISDADGSQDALMTAEDLLRGMALPVINRPDQVGRTGRAAVARILAGIPGVITPRISPIARDEITRNKTQAIVEKYRLDFPLLLRTPGFHTGRHFLRIDDESRLKEGALSLPGEYLLAIQYLDTRETDGYFRKYRVMMIDGILYPYHLALSRHWKVHYFTADMASRSDHRKEEARFLDDMAGSLGERVMNILHRISTLLNLDYAGIDFGINAKGDLVLFEANATMVVNPPETGEKWDYKRQAFAQISSAFERMLINRAGEA